MIIRLEHDALIRRSYGRHHANRMLSLDLPTLPSMEASSHLVMNAYVTSRECWIRSDVRESSRCARPPRMTWQAARSEADHQPREDDVSGDLSDGWIQQAHPEGDATCM